MERQLCEVTVLAADAETSIIFYLIYRFQALTGESCVHELFFGEPFVCKPSYVKYMFLERFVREPFIVNDFR